MFLRIETPHGFACLTITVPIFFGKDFEIKRAEALLKEKIDLIVVDTAHGHTKKVAEIVKKIKRLKSKTAKIRFVIPSGFNYDGLKNPKIKTVYPLRPEFKNLY